MKQPEYGTWVLVCNASRARLFGVHDRHRPWVTVQGLIHPGSRLKGMELTSDRPGRTQESARPGVSTRMEPTIDPKEREARAFALELTALLEKGRTEHAYAHLILTAPPHFLGLLREHLSPPTQQLVHASLDKDYTHVADQELPKLLYEVLAASGIDARAIVL